MSEPLDVDAIERAARCPCEEPGCSAEAREPTVLALVGEVRRLRAEMQDALEALDDYGQHRPSCGHGIKRRDGTVNPCDCGWQQWRDKINGAS